MQKRIGILTGGGDVPPLNVVIATAIERSREKNIELIGFLNGWQGILDENFINLSNVNLNPFIGGTILKSSRVNLKKVRDAEDRIESVLRKNEIDGLIVIGGEDTLSNSLLLRKTPQILISKTIDNDVGIINGNNIVNYFTLGYPTAAEKISSFVSLNEGLRTTAYAHERIIVVESMGMHAGWLALSSSFGHPDFIIIPEFPLDYDLLFEKVIHKYNLQKNLIIVIAEGSRWKNGKYISASEDEKDSFGHPKFKGAAEALSKKLKVDLKQYSDIKNVNSVNPSYLYRSGKPNELDIKAAAMLGKESLNKLDGNLSEPIFLALAYSNSNLCTKEYNLKNIIDIEELHRFVDSTFYNSDEFTITEEGKEYLSKIIREFPELEYKLGNS